MFIVGGFNAYPAEIENFLLRHPDIRQAAVDRRPRRAPGRGGHGLRRDRAGDALARPTSSSGAGTRWPTTRCPRVVEVVDELPRQRHRQGHEGRPAPAGRRRTGTEAAGDVTGAGRTGPRRLRRPPGRGDGGVGGRPVGRRAAGRLGCRRHQGRGARRATRCARSSDRSASRATCPTRPSPWTTGASAASSSTCATGADRQHLEDLLDTADVFISNLRPDSLDGLGLEPAATVARHPRLVYCSISGYGLRGEDRDRPTYDIGAFWARSGLSVQMADADGQPAERPGRHRRPHHRPGRPGRPAGRGDGAAGRPGGGRVVEVSLLRTGTYVLGLGPRACR